MHRSSIKILFFGLFKDIMGSKQFEYQLTSNLNIKSFLLEIEKIIPQFKQIKEFIDDKSQKQPVFIFLNGNPINHMDNIELKSGDEVAFLPPVGGG